MAQDIAITINIPPDVFEAIKARAATTGTPWPAVASSLLQHVVLHSKEIFGEDMMTPGASPRPPGIPL